MTEKKLGQVSKMRTSITRRQNTLVHNLIKHHVCDKRKGQNTISGSIFHVYKLLFGVSKQGKLEKTCILALSKLKGNLTKITFAW